jgi:hypothetical protein
LTAFVKDRLLFDTIDAGKKARVFDLRKKFSVINSTCQRYTTFGTTVVRLCGNKLACLANEKKFSDIDSRCQRYITLLLVLLQENKLECFTVEKQFLRLKIYSFLNLLMQRNKLECLN